MTLFKEDDVFGYKDANEIKKFWATASEPDPATVETGEIYLDINSLPYKLKRYNGTKWETVGGVPSGTSDPAVSVSTGGNLFLNTAATPPKLKRYNGSAWEEVCALSDSEILTAVKNVDGTGSGLDADTVDGIQASSLLRSDADDSFSGTLTSTIGTETVINFPNADSCITIHDGYGNFNFKSGVDDDNIVTTVDGGSHIYLAHSGYILAVTSVQPVDAAFSNDIYLYLHKTTGITFKGPVTFATQLVIPTGTPSGPINGSIWL
ncbi:MAG: hypothetical protein GY950_04165 [bacterium]|nr:hypothetical protein [bacterium]